MPRCLQRGIWLYYKSPVRLFAALELFAELVQRIARNFFEMGSQMTLGGKSQVSSNFNIGIVRVYEQVFGAVDFLAYDVLWQSDSLTLFEEVEEVIRMVSQCLGEFIDRDAVMQMGKDIILTLFDVRIFFYGSDRPCWVLWSFSTEKRECAKR